MLLLIYTICFFSTIVGVHADTRLASQQQPIQITSDSFDPSFDEYVEDLLKECHVPGVSVAVVDNGKVTSKVSLPPRYANPSSLRLSTYLRLVGLRLRRSPRYKSHCRYAVLYC